jgi:ABC-2 type transport system ATP-binding protein
MIQVEKLTKSYGSYQALREVTFSVEKGEILGFLGPNGAGKTTTMRILTCFFPPTSGKATVAGFDVFEEPHEVRKRIGYLPESVPLYRDMAVTDYLSFVAGIKGVAARDVRKRVEVVMDECGLTHMSHKMINELSKGYRQRVGLAQALVNEPEVLILDEPTAGLDPKQIIEIRRLIKDLAGRRTIILSTHILPEVSMTCQRVVIINEGRVIAVDTPRNLTSKIQGGGRIVVKVDGPWQEVSKGIQGISGIRRIDRKDGGSGVSEFTIDTAKGLDLRKDIASVVVKNGWGLLELRPMEMSLEDIFVKLVTKE